jgi:hypothetical protein
MRIRDWLTHFLQTSHRRNFLQHDKKLLIREIKSKPSQKQEPKQIAFFIVPVWGFVIIQPNTLIRTTFQLRAGIYMAIFGHFLGWGRGEGGYREQNYNVFYCCQPKKRYHNEIKG